MPTLSAQLPYMLLVLVLFTAYGALVRQGRIKDRNVLITGAIVSVVAVATSALYWWPYLQKGMPLWLYLFHPVFLFLMAVFCVYVAYQSQIFESVATYALGDSKILVQVCPPQRLPDAQALLLPTDTNLRLADGVAGYIGVVTGGALSQELRRLGPVNQGHVVATGAGLLKIGTIYHVAVSDNVAPVAMTALRNGIEQAAKAAKKQGAESVVLPIAALRGLTTEESAAAMLHGILRHHQAFAEIVIAIFNPRDRDTVARVISEIITQEGATPLPGGRK